MLLPPGVQVMDAGAGQWRCIMFQLILKELAAGNPVGILDHGPGGEPHVCVVYPFRKVA